MKAKLIKTPEGLYKLKFDNDNDMLLCATALLSAKNCDEIFGVVDVDKLAKQFTIDESYGEISGDLFKGYIYGFNKAMELNKDKVFTLEDLEKAYLIGCEYQTTHRYHIDENLMTLKLKQQPTEIEVTFNPEEKDSDGCLILTKL
jgi:hypothetical protein